MTKVLNLKNFLQFSIILTVLLLSSQQLFAQSQQEAIGSLKGKTMLAASFRYQNLPDNMDIKYFGLLFEHYLSDKFSISGPFYVGKSSNDRTYIHFPLGGLLTVFFIKIIFREFVDIGGLFEPGTIKYLFTENINYNIRVKDKLIISPYLSFLGLDGGIVSNGESKNTGKASISNGIGLSIKEILSKNWTFCCYLDYKHFSGNNFKSSNHFGYAAWINIGYTF